MKFLETKEKNLQSELQKLVEDYTILSQEEFLFWDDFCKYGQVA